MAMRIGVVLSGCGVFDGSEIHEAVLTILHLQKLGAEPVFMAPDIVQSSVINHVTQEKHDNEQEERNVLVESARITRGKIKNIYEVYEQDLDGLIFPGGFGAAKNLSDFGLKVETDEVSAELHVTSLINDMHNKRKPIGFICIAPAAIGAVALRGQDINFTIGEDAGVAARIRELGNGHVVTAPTEILVDEGHNIISTPGYMSAKNIVEVEAGIAKLVKEVVQRAQTWTAPETYR